jgi:hypothetical protein
LIDFQHDDITIIFFLSSPPCHCIFFL